MNTITSAWTTETGTTPMFWAKAFQVSLPAATPRGIPITRLNRGDRRGLPVDGGADLAVEEPERLQDAHVAAAPRHGDDEEVEERRHPEEADHDAQDQREVDRLPEVDQRPRQGGDGRVGLEHVR